jgi:hypothetical protein
MTNEGSLATELSWTELLPGEPNINHHLNNSSVILFQPLTSNGQFRFSVATGGCVTEPLPSIGHICHNVMGKKNLVKHTGLFLTVPCPRDYVTSNRF